MTAPIRVLVLGVFGDPWLSTLYGSAIGPSPAPYRMGGELVEQYPDGSALVHGKMRTWDGMVKRHPDGSRCNRYPCNLEHTRRYEVEHEQTTCKVPAWAWKLAE